MVAATLLIPAAFVVALLHFLYQFLFHAPSLKEYVYPYKEPGHGHCLRFWWKWLSLKCSPSTTSRFQQFNGKGSHTFSTPTPAEKRITGMDIPTFDDKVTDEISLCGCNVSQDSVLDVCVARRGVTEAECWLKFQLFDQQNGIRKSYTIPRHRYQLKMVVDSGALSYRVNDLSLTCLEPLKKWRIHYNGHLRDDISKQIDHVTFSYIWQPFTTVLDHQHIISDFALAQTLVDSNGTNLQKLDDMVDQFDQWGTLFGTYSINDSSSTQLILRGNKSRFAGNFDWSEIIRYIRIRVYIDDGRVLSFNAASSGAEIPSMTWGYVNLSTGANHSITKTDFSLLRVHSLSQLPRVFSIRLHSDADEYILDLITDVDNNMMQQWGQRSDVTVDVAKLNAVVTNLTQGYSENGVGSVHFFKRSASDGQPCWKNASKCVRNSDVKDSNQDAKVLNFNDPACANEQLTGGKGSSLAYLKLISDQDFSVPNGFCISILANQEHVQQTPDLPQAIQHLTDVCSKNKGNEIQETCERISKLFIKSSLSDDLVKKIKNSLKEQFGEGFENKKFAVRSSASGEDGEEMSGAGQLETLLGCIGLAQIIDAVKKCWASCYGLRAVQYRRQNGQVIEVGMSVVVQEMVGSNVAGVMFTKDPRTGHPGRISISANYGLGESVVSASSDPDSIIISRSYDDELKVSDITLGAKEVQIIMKGDGGVEEVKNSKSECCLTQEFILKLAQIGVKVENSYGDSRDIEWAIKDDKIYLLQARPITALDNMTEYELINEFNSPSICERGMLTSGNIREVMPGALAPLTSSFIFPSLTNGVLSVLLSVAPKAEPYPILLRSNVCTMWNRFADRVEMSHGNNEKYPNKKSQHMKKCFDAAFNGRHINDARTKEIGLKRYGYISIMNKVLSLVNFVKDFARTKRNLETMRLELGNWTFQNKCKKASDLAEIIFSSQDKLSTSVCYHLRVTFSSVFSNADVLADLLGSNDEVTDIHLGDFAKLMSVSASTELVESADVPAALKKLAAEILKYITVEEFVSMSKKECIDWLTSSKNPVNEVYKDVLTKHGHRSVKEFDMFTKTWDMDQAQLVQPLQAIMKQKTENQPKKMSVDDVLKILQTNLTPSQKKSLRAKVIKARENVAYREQAKSLMIRTIHQYRKELWKLADMMVLEGRLPEADLLMFMTVTEIRNLFRTRSSQIIQRAIRRKRLLPKLDNLVFPELVVDVPEPINGKIEVPEGAFTIVGTPVSQGVIQAKARVITKIADAHLIQPGEILVTYGTDIAWSPYFPILAGVVTEIGGLISHGAVVAREYGIPCIVGVQNATFIIKSGDVIILDGGSGKISKIN